MHFRRPELQSTGQNRQVQCNKVRGRDFMKKRRDDGGCTRWSDDEGGREGEK